MVDTAPSISTNDTIFDVGDTLYVTITFNGSVGGYLYVGDTEISIVAPKGVSSYTYSYDLTTSGVYNVHFYDYLNMLDSNIIAITVNNPISSSAFLIKITKVKTALENVFVKKSDIKNNLTSTDVDKPLSANQGKVLNDNKEDKNNKSSNITTDTGSIIKYPTVKAVEDYAQPIGNYLTSHQDLSNYVQKSQTNGLIKNDGTIDSTTYLSSLPSHTHGNLQNDGSVGTSDNASKNVVTDSNGQITIEDKPTIPFASSTKPSADTTNGSVGTGTTWAKADHTHPKSTIYAESSHNHTTLTSVTSIMGLFTNQQQKIIFYRPNQGQWNFIDNKISYDGTNITYNSSEIATIDDIPTLLSDLTNDSSFIETSNTIGLIKNDGTIDTNTYLTAHQTLPTIADNLTTNDATQVLSAKQGKWLKDNTASASHDHAQISGGVSGAIIFDDTDGMGMYALGNRIIYDWNDSDLVYYDRNGIGVTEDNEIATKGDISDAIGDAITYINQ